MSAKRNRVTLGIGGSLGHDANAAVMVDGELVAASQEERYTRRKHDGRFPENAARDCLSMVGLRFEDVNACVFSEKLWRASIYDRTGVAGMPLLSPISRLLRAFDRRPAFGHPYAMRARQLMPTASMRFSWHHLTHVVGAWFTSHAERAAFLCVDGKGEDSNASIGRIGPDGVEVIWELRGENGIGMLYTLCTRYLGFPSFGSEYKVMGLAPYGSPRFADAIRDLCHVGPGGALRLKHRVPFTDPAIDSLLPWVADRIGFPVRGSESPLTDVHADIAASLQVVFQESVLDMARYARKLTSESNLLFAGGCAQNCVAAGIIRRASVFDNVFNSPVGGDMATGLGAALLDQWHSGLLSARKVDDRGYYLGPEPGPVPDDAIPYEISTNADLFGTVANELASGKIVAWCRGRMELGARALGARSILADARIPGMQSRLNLAVKFREGFRPFAPLILEERASEWFDIRGPSRYMQFVEPLREDRRRTTSCTSTDMRSRLDQPRSDVNSVVHVDYTARLQTVDRATHPDMHRLLTEFDRITGVPILINTSFNVAGEPIVRSAQEAFECFLNTDVDLLVLGDRLFRNPMLKSRQEKLAWVERFKSLA